MKLTIAICIVSAAVESMTISGTGSRVENGERRMVVKSVSAIDPPLDALSHFLLTDRQMAANDIVSAALRLLIFIRTNKNDFVYVLVVTLKTSTGRWHL